MTIADKLTYLSETKDLLALAINKVLYTRGEAPMDDSSSFRDFVAQLFSPEYLYVDGEQGSGWKGLDGVFSDEAGTVPATWGDPVAVVSDDLIEDGEWVQPTTTARPILGRVPVGGRRNHLTHTVDTDNPIWTAQNVVKTGSLIMETEGETAHSTYNNIVAELNIFKDREYTFSIDLQEGTGTDAPDYMIMGFATNGFGSSGHCVVNVQTGEVSYSQGLSRPVRVEPSERGGFRFWVSKVATESATEGTRGGFVAFANNDPDYVRGTAYVGNPLANAFVERVQLEEGPGTQYQEVGTTAYDITEAGVPSVPHLIFDQVDDALTTATLPATADGSIAIAGRDGVWIGPLSHAGGNFTIGPATFNGGPRKLLKHLGGVLADGVRTIDRPITEAERKLLAAYYISKGSPKVFDRGSSWAGLDGLFSDAAGTIPATWGDPVAVIDDGSINDNEWVQGTSTARPRLGRVPVGGRRNLLRWTEDFTNSFWLKGNGASVIRELIGGVWFNKVIAADGVSASTGNTGSQVRTDHIPTVPGNRYAVRLLAKPAEFTVASIFVQEVEGFTVDLELLTTSRPDIVSVEGLGDGVVEIKFSGVPTRDDVKIRLGASGTGDGSSGIYYSEVQFERGEESTPYQKVDSEYDITEAGVPDAYYLRFDGVDDAVDTTLPAITKGTLVLAGTKGIWIDDDFNHAGGTFSIGPTSYTGGPSSILGAVGDLIVGGCFVIDRQLTPEERTRVINKLKELGAPGVFELGPELIVNGDFSDGLTGWSVVGMGTGSVTPTPSGIEVIRGPWTNLDISQTFNPTLPPGSYLHTLNVVSTEGNNRFGPGTFTGWSSALGVRSAVFTRTVPSGNVIIQKGGDAGQKAVFRGYSLRKLELIP